MSCLLLVLHLVGHRWVGWCSSDGVCISLVSCGGRGDPPRWSSWRHWVTGLWVREMRQVGSFFFRFRCQGTCDAGQPTCFRSESVRSSNARAHSQVLLLSLSCTRDSRKGGKEGGKGWDTEDGVKTGTSLSDVDRKTHCVNHKRSKCETPFFSTEEGDVTEEKSEKFCSEESSQQRLEHHRRGHHIARTCGE